MAEIKESHKVTLDNWDFFNYLESSTSRDAKPWSGRQGFALVWKGDFNGS